MRRIVLLISLFLLTAACGGDEVLPGVTAGTTEPPTSAAASTTGPTSSTSSPAPTTSLPTTSTTSPGVTTTTWETFGVAAADLCVIDHPSDDALNVRSGPGTDFEVIGTLPFDATGVHATGRAAYDDGGRTWKEIDYSGGAGWVAGWLVTANACDLGGPGQYFIREPLCGLSRLEVHSGPGTAHAVLGTLRWNAWPVEATGASSLDAASNLWRQIRLRGEVGWVPAANLGEPPAPAVQCAIDLIPPSTSCVDGWWDQGFGSASLYDALKVIGVAEPPAQVDIDAFVVEEARYFTGPEDAQVISPRPNVERWYIVGYAETDPSFRGRWLIRRATFGMGLAAVAPYGSTGFGPGIWETCVDPCQVGRPLAGEWCDPACVEDYISRSCEGLVPGVWSPGDCAGPPPEVLGCLEP